MELIAQNGDWRCYCHSSERHIFVDGVDFEPLLKALRSLPETLKDNHRSAVLKGELLGRDVVAKQPRDKHRRLWSRLVSLWSEGESYATIKNLLALQESGVESVKPLFALECRKFGMVVDSWACYEYRAGNVCTQHDTKKIIEFLGQMHVAGFRHGDPTWNNFLYDPLGVMFTIDTKAQACRGTFHQAYDFVLFKRANKLKDFDLHELDLNRRTPGYWLAMAYMSVKVGRSALKDALRKNRPKNT